MDRLKSIELGRKAAGEASVFGWGVFGFFIAILAIPIAYLRSPEMPTEVVPDREGLDVEVFESAYVNRLKRGKAKAAWLGLVVAIAVWYVLIGVILRELFRLL